MMSKFCVGKLRGVRRAGMHRRRLFAERLEDRRVLASIVVIESGGSTLVNESPLSTDSFTVNLSQQPASDVVVRIHGGDVGEATIDKTSLTFTNANWNVPQTVSIAGVVDSVRDYDQTPKYRLSVDDSISNSMFHSAPDAFVLATVSDVDQWTGFAGGGLAHENRQPSLGLNYLIALQGIYPTGGMSPDGSQPILGEIVAFAGNTVPNGWARADGQLLSISQNVALFSILGTTFGGNGTTTFGLPDLRGRTIVGAGGGPGLSTRVTGEQFGTNTTSLTISELPSHDHSVPGTSQRTGLVGGGQAVNNLQPSLALKYSLNTSGFYPPRDGVAGNIHSGYLGVVSIYANPSGAADVGSPAHGQVVSISGQNPLFSLLGTMYGGNGSSTFAYPDLRGRTPIHSGNSDGLGLDFYPLGAAVGTETIALTPANLPSDHDHSIYGSNETGDTGSGQSHNTVQPSLGLNYVINLSGSYPAGSFSSSHLGAINVFAGNYAPNGTAFLNGQLLSIFENSALFSLIGNTYGGDGVNTFALPDLRGRTPVHNSSGTGAFSVSLGQQFGQENVSLTEANLPSHRHTAPANVPIIVDTEVDELDADRSAGDLSLREAIALANSNPDHDVIQFSPSLAGKTIALSLDQMLINKSITINGLGADQLTINAGGNSRIFDINDGTSSNISVEINGLTLSGGSSVTPAGQGFLIGSGGAIRSFENLTVRQSTLTGNTVSGIAFGGGIFSGGAGSLTVRNSTLSGNSAYSGGGLINYSTGPALIDHATISGNTANNYAGGGIFNQHVLTIVASTITNNRGASPSGFAGSGGLHTRGGKNVIVRDSILSGNFRATAGGEVNDDFRNSTGNPSIITGRHNLIGTASATGLVDGTSGNKVGVTNPMLGGLAYNGGPTQTHALLPTSPAIDSGSSLHAYELNGSLTNQFSGPPLVANGGTLTSSGYQFDSGKGLSLSGALSDPAGYTISIDFSFNSFGGYLRILDFKNLGIDNGLYALNNRLVLYQDGEAVTSGNVFTANTLHRLIFSRNSATNLITASVDGVDVWSYHDSNQLAVFSGPSQIMHFFRDDGFENPVGFVDRIRIWSNDNASDQRGTPFLRNHRGVDIGALELQVIDFADAPQPYPTSIASNGASHQAIGPRLGNTRDGEINGQPSATASGDANDEDGVLFGGIVPGNTAGININLQNSSAAKVDAWIDFDRDGSWDDVGEQILSSIAVFPGLQTLNFNVNAGVTSGITFARVRVSTAGGLTPTGPAGDGEVEDYQVTIGSQAPIATATVNSSQATRSEIKSIEVQFSSIVQAIPSDFVLQNTTTGQYITDISVSRNNSSGSTLATLTFGPGPSVITSSIAGIGNTLANGNYELRYRPATLNGTTSPVLIDRFFRKFGDDSGDSLISLSDFAAFRGAFGKSYDPNSPGNGYKSGLDFNRDGVINLTDFASFRGVFGT